MTKRSYLVGLPVGVTVDDDGTVTVCTYLEDVADIEIHEDDDQNITDAQMTLDTARIVAAYNSNEIRVERSTGTEARTPCHGKPCANDRHDHTEQPDDIAMVEMTEETLVPMICHDCGVPTHYDYGDEDYHHDDPETPPCFLIQEEMTR